MEIVIRSSFGLNATIRPTPQNIYSLVTCVDSTCVNRNTTDNGDIPQRPAQNQVCYNICYVAICDRRNLWRCRNLWLKMLQFVTGVAICDGKCRNLWQRRNMQFNDAYSLNFDKKFVLSSYLY